MSNRIAFIHLSDIHFNRFSGDSYDVDKDLRNEVFMDIKTHFLPRKTQVDGILICGDIAFSGKQCEYEIAATFLGQLCDMLGIEKNQVFCVPGNHDIDQATPKNEAAVKALQDQLSQANGLNEFDRLLSQIMRGEHSSKMLLQPLTNYNEHFASQFLCGMVDKLTWQYDFDLNPDLKLRLFGINSTIISNSDDHAPGRTTERLMRIGSVQIPSRYSGIINMTLCHHPPDCWDDPDKVLAQKMKQRAAIQLFGHKHLQKIVASDRSIMIGSGATHPSRGEPGWTPRYNWIEIESDEMNSKGTLKVRVFQRLFSTDSNCFVKDVSMDPTKDYDEYLIDISEDPGSTECEVQTNIVPSQNTPCGELWRKAAYAFMKLSFIDRWHILKEFKLLNDDEWEKQHSELLLLILQRAESRNVLQNFISAIETREHIGGVKND